MKVYVLIRETEERYTSIVNIFEDEQIANKQAKEFQLTELDSDIFYVETYATIKKPTHQCRLSN